MIVLPVASIFASNISKAPAINSRYGVETLSFPFQDDPSSEILTPDHRKVPTNADANRDINNLEVQTQLPIQTTKEPTFLELLLGEEDFDLPPLIPEDTNFDGSATRIQLPKMSFQDNNAIETAELKPPGQISNRENIVSGPSAGSGPQFSGSPAKVEQDSQITALNNHDAGGCLCSLLLQGVHWGALLR